MIALYFLSVWGAFTCSYMRATSSPEDFILYRYIPQVIGLTFMLLFIAYLKGEKPHWSSGDTNKKEKK